MKRREAPLIKVPLVIPRKKAFPLVAAGSHHITNFDAASAWQAARWSNAPPALLTIALGQRVQGREVRTGIERGKIVKTRVECLLQSGESCLFIAASCIGRTEPEIVDVRWGKGV